MSSKTTRIFFVMFFISLAAPSPGKYSGGTGEPNDPYLIATPNDLNSIGLDPNDWDKNFLMINDINMVSYSYTTALIAPDINNLTLNFQGTPFSGVFDGNDHTIFSLVINGGSNGHLGLFGKLAQATNIINLRVEDANIIGDDYCGGLCGYNEGDIINCHFAGTLTGHFNVGGLCGYNTGNVSNCYSTTSNIEGYHDTGVLCGANLGNLSNCHVSGTVTGASPSSYTGGLCGYNDEGIISSCSSTAQVTGTSETGGLCGFNHFGDITNCYSTSTVTGQYDTAGLCGENWGNISNCYSTSIVIGYLDSGGLCGYNDEGSITNCYSVGDVTGDSDYTGGLCGFNDQGTISNCYSTSSINGDDYVGGLCGYSGGGEIKYCFSNSTIVADNYVGGLCGQIGSSVISNCYSEGTVTGYSHNGGFCGRNFNGTISNCYSTAIVTAIYDTGGLCGSNFGGSISASFFLESAGPDNELGLPLTDAQMKQQSSFVNWDFINVWDIGENQTYPFLRTHLPSDINKDDGTNFYDFAILAAHWLNEK